MVVVTACLVGVVGKSAKRLRRSIVTYGVTYKLLSAVSSYGMGYHAKQLSFDENTFILKVSSFIACELLSHEY